MNMRKMHQNAPFYLQKFEKFSENGHNPSSDPSYWKGKPFPRLHPLAAFGHYTGLHISKRGYTYVPNNINLRLG